MAEIMFSKPNELSDDEFKHIAGTELFVRMLRNRLIYRSNNTGYHTLKRWLADHATSFYYLTGHSTFTVYIESDADATALHLAFHGVKIGD